MGSNPNLPANATPTYLSGGLPSNITVNENAQIKAAPGVFYGLAAGLITLILFYPLTWWLGGATENFLGGINIFSYYLSHFGLFFLAIVGTGVVLGGVASFLAVRRYLKI